MLEVYVCRICGNIVQVLHTGVGVPVCCGQPMELQKEKTQDQGMEKHVPVVESDGTVKVGSVPHPMEENHHIEWIEVITETGTRKVFLKPGEKPEARFSLEGSIKEVRAYCNVHGLWKR